jgi:uncharacterized protein (DUF4415 family)
LTSTASTQYPPLTNGEIAEIERGFARSRRKLAQMPEPTPEEAKRLHAAALADPDSPPLRDDAVLRPLYQVMPEFIAKRLRARRGRPVLETPKKQVTLRLDQDVFDHFRAGGPGWQTRINEALRKVAGKKRAGGKTWTRLLGPDSSNTPT